VRLDHVGLHKGFWPVYRTVHVGLRGEVHDGREMVFGEQTVHQLPIPDPPPHENVVGVLRDRKESLRVARISKGVQVDHLELPRRYRVEYEVATDKTRAAGNEDGLFLSLQCAPLFWLLAISHRPQLLVPG
jgi:hypothetical protein